MTDAEIVRLLAEKVMGWSVLRQNQWHDAICAQVWSPWNPLVSDTDACAVLDRIAQWGTRISLQFQADYGWICSLKNPGTLSVYGAQDKDRRRAICIAALKVVGAYKEEEARI